jgi:hypothetical protein
MLSLLEKTSADPQKFRTKEAELSCTLPLLKWMDRQTKEKSEHFFSARDENCKNKGNSKFYGVNAGPSLYFYPLPATIFNSWEIYSVMLHHHAGEVNLEEGG